MDDKCIFSIIIPVYKVEEYLENCVDSILNQRFPSFEIILIDDGSPDLCPHICDKYAADNKNVTVIHKENGGSSSARNRGMEAAGGKYILFVDSDDYWNSDCALATIYEKIKENDVDVIVFNNIDYSCLSNESVVCNRTYNAELMETGTRTEVLHYLIQNDLFPGAAWVTVTRRQFLIDNHISFIEGIKAEDVDWLINVFLHAGSYSAVNMAFYVYRKYRGGSITNTADVKSLNDLIYTLDIWCERLRADEFEEVKQDIYILLCRHYLCAVLLLDGIPMNEKKCCIERLQKYSFLISCYPQKTVRLCRWLPIGVLSKMLIIFRKKRKL